MNIKRFMKVKYEIWLLPQRCFKVAMKTKALYVIQANNYMVLPIDTTGAPGREITPVS